MLKKLNISNFKCFNEVSISFGKITLFSGTNSSGKSSAIQALLLIDHSSQNTNSQLNSNWLDLGSFEEARNFITRAESFSIELETYDNAKSSFTYRWVLKIAFFDFSQKRTR